MRGLAGCGCRWRGGGRGHRFTAAAASPCASARACKLLQMTAMEGALLSGAAGPEIAAIHWPIAIGASAATHACWFHSKAGTPRNLAAERLVLKLESLKRPKKPRRKPSKQGSCMIVADGASIYPLPGVFVLGKPVLSSLAKTRRRTNSQSGAHRGSRIPSAVPSIRKSIDSGRAPASVAPVETKKASNGHSAKNRARDAADAKKHSAPTTTQG